MCVICLEEQLRQTINKISNEEKFKYDKVKFDFYENYVFMLIYLGSQYRMITINDKMLPLQIEMNIFEALKSLA